MTVFGFNSPVTKLRYSGSTLSAFPDGIRGMGMGRGGKVLIPSLWTTASGF